MFDYGISIIFAIFVIYIITKIANMILRLAKIYLLIYSEMYVYLSICVSVYPCIRVSVYPSIYSPQWFLP